MLLLACRRGRGSHVQREGLPRHAGAVRQPGLPDQAALPGPGRPTGGGAALCWPPRRGEGRFSVAGLAGSSICCSVSGALTKLSAAQHVCRRAWSTRRSSSWPPSPGPMSPCPRSRPTRGTGRRQAGPTTPTPRTPPPGQRRRAASRAGPRTLDWRTPATSMRLLQTWGWESSTGLAAMSEYIRVQLVCRCTAFRMPAPSLQPTHTALCSALQRGAQHAARRARPGRHHARGDRRVVSTLLARV